MKKFINAFKDFRERPKEHNCLLVWNPTNEPWNKNQWLVTIAFSKKLIEARGMEVVYG